MKKHPTVVSATSLPRAPEEETASRVRHYVITMSIRMACFALMVLITPYGWYTWVFGIGAAVLPYIAVVIANAGADGRAPEAEEPSLAVEAGGASINNQSASPTVVTVVEVTPRGADSGSVVEQRDDRSGF